MTTQFKYQHVPSSCISTGTKANVMNGLCVRDFVRPQCSSKKPTYAIPWLTLFSGISLYKLRRGGLASCINLTKSSKRNRSLFERSLITYLHFTTIATAGLPLEYNETYGEAIKLYCTSLRSIRLNVTTHREDNLVFNVSSRMPT